MTPMRPPVQLDLYYNSWYDPGGSLFKRAMWFFLGQPILRAAWIPSSSLRVALLRLFGATIGNGVVIKPAVDVKYPWHLKVGDSCWIGERVWIDNLTTVCLHSNVCISQGAYLCTGNHDWTDPYFGLRVAPVTLRDGTWVGAKAFLAPGVVLELGSVVAAGSVVSGTVPAFAVYAGNPARFLKNRIIRSVPQEATNAGREKVAGLPTEPFAHDDLSRHLSDPSAIDRPAMLAGRQVMESR